MKYLILLLLTFPAFAANIDGLPDPKLTPGATNPNVTQQNIETTICVSGYTKTIRPPASYTNALKKKQIKQYGYADRNPSHYEEDHAISLELGGHPTDPKNLWPQPRKIASSAAKKDKLENYLHREVCANRMTLKQAQHIIMPDWTVGYRKYIGGN